jgi:hypothetical protein
MADSLIAAIVMSNRGSRLTRNMGHFEELSVHVDTP